MIRRWTILVVEDDPLFLESLTMLLEEEGLDVVGARSAEEALDAAAGTVFDLVVTDVRMPGMNGIAMLDRVQHDSPHTRGIVLTGYAEFPVPVESVRVRVDDFVTKPFDRRAFLASVRRSLEWLEREDWWKQALAQAHDEACTLVDALLPAAHPAEAEVERATRSAARARHAAQRLGVSADEARVVAWAAAAGGAPSTRVLALRKRLAASTPAAGSPAGLLVGALDLAAAVHAPRDRSRTPHPPSPPEVEARTVLLEAVHALDAGVPPHDLAISPRMRDALLGDDRPDDVPDRLLPDDAPPSARSSSLLALGMSYLHAGRFDLARDALRQVRQTGARHFASAHAIALALAEAGCGESLAALQTVERAHALAADAVAEAAAQAARGALRVRAGRAGGADELDEAVTRLHAQGATRDELRARLLGAWAWAGRLRDGTQGRSADDRDEGDRTSSGNGVVRLRRRFRDATRCWLDRLEDTHLTWTLHADHWLARDVLERAEREGIEQERIAAALGQLRRAGTQGPDAAQSASLRLEAFGVLRIRVGQRTVLEDDWKTVKSKWLFLILALHAGREVPDERLTDLLWESQDADRARKNLYSTLTYVRRALFPNAEIDPVLHRRGRCQLNPQLDAHVDFVAFEDAVRRGLAACDAGKPNEGASALQGAVDVYEGDLLENYEEEWITPYRSQYRERAVQALERLLDCHRARGDVTAGLATAERVLAIDRCHQGACQYLMRAAIDAGQAERAARLYRACIRALEEDLHIGPGARTREIYEEIARGDAP